MIRVTFELLPGGDESRARKIGLMEICNLRTRLDGTADYGVVLTKTPPFSGALKAAWRKGQFDSAGDSIDRVTAGEDDETIVAEVEGHHRTRRGVYDLAYRALSSCGLASRNR